ncbi:ABC-type multidrug transport system [Elusimicrobium minutum Pei191]|uniref:ABC-type multidrug transport system n=1 Tax=Elusimicrobium minutum (strain Pei191) TaxID=445932 RepID=B2KD39_ELUMP|nr:ABC transporter ATP-binding protein [Elusimicrobium minutum]ACC98435.1 ABC-type multidrug transport system [Elusimicrobium minutum Pei191]
MIKILNAATQGQAKKMLPMLGWTVLEYALRGAPYAVLLFVVYELFKPLETPGAILNTAAIMKACIILFIIIVLLCIVNTKSFFSAYKDGYTICAGVRLKMADHLRRLSMGFYNAKDPGDIGAYLVNDYANIEQLVTHLVPQVVGGVTMPLVLLISLAFFNLKLALAAGGVILLALPALLISIKICRFAGKIHQQTKTSADSRMIEYIQGIKFIKAFNLGGDKFERLENAFRKLKIDSIRLEGGSGPTIILSSLVLNTGIVIIMLYGFKLFTAGQLELSVYLMFLILGSRIYEPLLQSLIFIGLITYMNLGVERMETLRKTPPIKEGKNNEKIKNFDIEFEDITFSYHNKQVIKNLSAKINSHALTAFVGPSGSGKTTLTRLIARFWDVDSGAVKLNGVNIKDYKLDNLLSCISMIFQDVYLFKDTIYNNIKIGKEDATEEEIFEAAKKARCHDFIMALPNQYNTLVGEAGSTLSGGERQRISIARAILKDAPIILIDEATAFLDPENELHIQQAINDLVKDKTVIVIAHRLNTIREADNIIVINNGKVEQQGRHDDLLSQGGIYKNLWDEQQLIKNWKF